MKQFTILVFLISLWFNISLGQSGWYSTNDSTSGYGMHKIQFTSSSTGYCIGYNATLIKSLLLRTTNGGTNWADAYTFNNFCSRDISFVNDLTGYTAGGTNFSNYLYFYKTTNGGLNWVFMDSLKGSYNIVGPDYSTHLDFYNQNIGIIRSELSYCYRTSDGGQNWVVIPDSGWFMGNTEKIKFLTGDNLVLFEEGKVLFSVNGGFHWNSVAPSCQNYDFSFINNSTGYCASKYNSSTVNCIRKTTNGGQNWSEVFQCSYVPVTCPYIGNVCFVNELTGFKSGSPGCIFKTTDGGVSWNTQLSNSPYATNDIYFLNANTGFCASNRGLILKTINGGTPVRNISVEIPSAYSLSQNYPNPFNSMCNVQFSMHNAGNVKLVVYDVQGREVQILVNESLQPGTYETTFDGSKLNSGVYFYKLTSGDFSETKRLLLIK